MRDQKTYLSMAPLVIALWFRSLARLLIEINHLFLDIPFFFILVNNPF